MRQGHLGDLRAHFLKLLHALVETGRDAGLEALAAEFLDETDLQSLQVALQTFTGGLHRRTRAFRNGGGITLVVAADHFLQQCRIKHGTGARTDLVERGGHGDGAETGDAAIGRLDADGTGQRARLANGAAGIGAQCERGFERGHRSRGTTAGTARHALGIPRVVGGLVGGMLGG